MAVSLSVSSVGEEFLNQGGLMNSIFLLFAETKEKGNMLKAKGWFGSSVSNTVFDNMDY